MTAALRFKGLLLSAAMLAICVNLPAVSANDINQHTDELRTIERQIENANARTASLDREREALEAELAGLSQRLVDLAGNIQNREARIRQTEVRLEQLATEEQQLRSNLAKRRAALADLLAGLQRLERNPPPPLAVEPEDARKAVRGSLLFGSIVPNLNGQAARLARELAELEAVRQRIVTARDELDTHVSNLAPARAELKQLLARKKGLLATNAD
jgi:septal ring factor EnvC (AmiA/AmiB activator)